MNPLSNKGLNVQSCFFIGIIIGILVGAAAFNIMGSYRLDSFYKRILKIEDKEFKLKVNKLILTEVMKIWISVEPVSQ